MPKIAAPASLSALPDSWAFPKVAEVGSVRLGRQRSPSKSTGKHPTPYLRSKNISTRGLDLDEVFEMDFDPVERAVYALRSGDVLLVEASGSASQVGRPAIWRDELPLCCYQNHLIRFRPHAATPEYSEIVFRHFMNSGEFARAARGIGILHLGKGRFADLRFPMPPIQEQGRIADEVARRTDELDRAREALGRALEALSAAESATLAAAATGSLAEMRPQEADGSGSAYRDLRDRLQIPAHWDWVTVEEAGEVTLGKSLNSRAAKSGVEAPYLRVANVQENEIDLSDLKTMWFSRKELARYELRPGDLLLNDGQSMELVGRPAMYEGGVDELGFQNHLLRFRAATDVDPGYALLVFRHYLHAGEFSRIARASTNIANLSRKRFIAMPFPKPPIAEQRKLWELASERLTIIEEQRATARGALEATGEMAAAVAEAAVTGNLVPQDPREGSAAADLALMGPPPGDAPRARLPGVVRRIQPIDMSQRGLLERILEVLKEADGEALTVRQLFDATGANPNDVGQIETFYRAVRDAAGADLEIIGKGEYAQVKGG